MKSIGILILGVLPLCACGAPQSSGQVHTAPSSTPQTPEPTGMMSQGMMSQGMMQSGSRGKAMADKCPMAVPGTTVRSEEIEGGATMTFTTTGDVSELRRRVAQMAKMHEQHATDGCPMMKMHDHPSGTPAAPPSEHDSHHPPAGG